MGVRMSNIHLIKSILVLIVIYLTSTPVLAKECFEASPFAANGGDIYIDQDIPPITTEQYETIKKMLETASGRWKGTMSVKECFGKEDDITVKDEDYEVEGETKFDGEKFDLKFELYSLKSKTRKRLMINYVLKDEYFSIDGRPTGNVEILSTTSTGVNYYKRYRQNQAGKTGSFVKESTYVLEVAEREIVLQEYQYINGELIAESILRLE
jgi:hypothetical protein